MSRPKKDGMSDGRSDAGGATASPRARLDPAALAAYVDGTLSPEEAAEVERVLDGSAEDRRRVEGLRRVRGALTAPLPEWEGIDLVARVRAAVVSPAVPTQARQWARPRWSLAAIGGAFAAAATVLVLMSRPRAPAGYPVTPPAVEEGVGEPVAKAAAPGGAQAPSRWAGIRVYREPAQAGASPVPLGAALPAGAGLMFTYSNLGPRPFEYLMIFARDAGGEVRWFYPVYASAAADPPSMPIRAGEADVSLGDLIRQPFHRGPLAIYALFSRHPLHVHEVERWLAGTTGAADTDAARPWPDTHLARVTASVEPDPPGGR